MKTIYRSEIDGLRAIAVGGVILYHAKLNISGYDFFQGGFIGVDIFFVISGYLITSIILKELLITGTFSFTNFYQRRIRRILPALLLVMMTSISFAWLYLLPGSLIDFSKSILYSIGFSSNFYFHYSGQDYGDTTGLLKPFLHTWSLSIEEQFYIIFPIILFFTFRYFKNYIIHLFIFGFIISLGLADWSSKNLPSFAFYYLPTRAWELLVGSILAYVEVNKGQRSNSKILNLISPIIGLTLIVYSFLFFNDNTFHPSIYTLFPVTGVCLIIWFSNKGEIVSKILSTRFFIWVGLISYSLYLWHYPIFAFSRITEFTEGNIYKKILLLIIVLSLSCISYYLVERPFRNKRYNFRIILSTILISILVLVTLNVKFVLEDGYQKRVPKIFRDFEAKPWNILRNSDGKECFDNFEVCSFNTLSNQKIYLVGDSHMASLMQDLKSKVVNKGYQFITSVNGGCIYFPEFDRIKLKSEKINKYCNNKYFKRLREILINEKDSIIIFGGRFPLYFSNRYFDNYEGGLEQKNMVWADKFVPVGNYDSIQNSFKIEVSKILENNKVILIYPIPEVGWEPKRKIFNQWISRANKLNRKFMIDPITTSYQAYKDRNKISFELFDSIKSKNLFRVYPHKLFCDLDMKNRCIIHDDENIFYSDSNHPSVSGSKMINNLIINKIKNIELESR